MTGQSTHSHASGPPCLHWQKHQTDFTPAPEPMFQPVILEQGMERPGGQSSPRQVAGSTTRVHAGDSAAESSLVPLCPEHLDRRWGQQYVPS